MAKINISASYWNECSDIEKSFIAANGFIGYANKVYLIENETTKQII